MRRKEFAIEAITNNDIRQAIANILTEENKGKEFMGFRISDKSYSQWDVQLPSSFRLADCDDIGLIKRLTKLLEDDFIKRQEAMIAKCDDIIKKGNMVLFDNKKYIAIIEASKDMPYCQVFQDIKDLYDRTIKSRAASNYKYIQRHREQLGISCKN